MSVQSQTRQVQVQRFPSHLPSAGITGILQRKCACGGSPGLIGECEECRKKHLTLQHRSTNQAEPSSVPPIVREALSLPSQPLDLATRAFMESRFGHDFSQVQVHTDAKAAESSRAVNALAYTVGRDIVFGAGQYAPETSKGRQLLAHELTHVVQQSEPNRISSLKLDHSTPSDSLEQEADRAANRVVWSSGLPVAVQSRSDAPAVQTAVPAAAVAAGVIAALGACAYGFYRYTLNNYSGRQGYNDKFMHCYASCKVASHCGSTVPGLGIPGPVSVLFSESAGILKEVADYIKDTFGVGTPADASWEDWLADNYGIGCSFRIFTPCEECCRSAPGAVAPAK